MGISKFNKTEVTLFKITNINSYRTLNEKEFRITQIKGAMRFWWRSFKYLENTEELLYEENILFGGKIDEKNTAKKSPIQIRCLTELKPNIQEIEFPITIELLHPEGFDYFRLLQLVSYLGGIGRNTRKGYGCFSVQTKKNANTPMSNIELADKIIEIIESYSDKKFKIEPDSTQNYITIHADMTVTKDYYVNEIYIFGKIQKKQFNERVMHSGIKKIKEKHIIISCYSADKGDVFPIITIFGNSDSGKNAFEQFKSALGVS